MKQGLSQLFTFLVALIVTSLFVWPQPAGAAVGSWQKGATIVPASPTDFSSANFQQSLRDLKATNANYVALIVPYYQSNTGSTDLNPGWNTPTDQSLIDGINYAHSQGLHVMLKIHAESNDGTWRAWINPGDRNAWFSAYGNILNKYADLAKAHGVESYCLGAELYSLTSANVNSSNTGYWEGMIQNVRSRYSGTLLYSAQHITPYEENEIQFWGSLDLIGLAAYFPVAQNISNPTPEQLTASWDQWNNQIIKPLSQRWNKPIIFTEVGYRSISGAHNEPWSWWSGGGADEAEQARDYEALFSYWNGQSFMQGVFWWEWESNPNAGGSGSTSYTPQNKQAEQVMTRWFGGSTASATPTASPTSSIPTPTVNEPSTLNPQTSITPTPSPLPSSAITPSLTPDNAQPSINPQSSSGAVDIWWPSNGATITGVQPFKAVLQGRDFSQYLMFWQVDGGQLNQMGDSSQDWPHKESSADVTGWAWNNIGPYTLNFIAKDSAGNVLGQSSSSVRINR